VRHAQVCAQGFLLLGLGGLGCGTNYIQTADQPTESGADGAADDAPAACGATLASRLTVKPVDVTEDIRYRRLGYNVIAEDERIAFSIASDGAPSVAWLEALGSRVHVTSLDGTLARRGADTVVDGTDVGGLVAQPDGAALLVSRTDPGEPLRDPAASNAIAKAAVLVRVRQGVEAAAMPLTGTASVVSATVGAARDCTASPLNGRLEWNGSRYGAYFVVHGCEGDTHASFYGDKLVYLDDGGRALPGGWDWGCSINQGIRLLPGPSTFTPICLSDSQPSQGLNLVLEGQPPVQLAPELSAIGYSAGQLGSIVRMGDGTFVIAWSSRGLTNAGGRPNAAKTAPDLAFLTLDRDYRVVIDHTWLSDTPDMAELGVHLAPYGPDRLLLTWEAFSDLQCNGQTCDGTFRGTHARLLDATGHFLTPDEIIPATPNELEDIRVFPNGDLGFAFVDVADRTRSIGNTSDGGAPAPPVRTLNIARVSYCK
jgi:hypothetical protein